ncbi:hypothetical protein [Streptomyces griseoluteus]|uniref:hypothetical protein n=1 Tax=Streptomyces griseoluteus TaxID=29306 RepID=UPI003439E2C5
MDRRRDAPGVACREQVYQRTPKQREHQRAFRAGVLGSARRLYERHGFRLTAEDRHHSFGHDLVGQTWRSSLRPSVTAGAVPPR